MHFSGELAGKKGTLLFLVLLTITLIAMAYFAPPNHWYSIDSQRLICSNSSKQRSYKHQKAGNTSRIPNILHYVFRDGSPFESYKDMIRSCLNLHPNWTVVLWRDSDSERLIREHYGYFLEKYSGYQDRLEKSDSVRYIILHKFGGIYLDMDVQCLRPFDKLLETPTELSDGDGISAFLGEERREQTRILYSYSFYTMNSLMGSVPGHPFFAYMIRRMLAMPRLNHARVSTGPDLLTQVYHSWVNMSLHQQRQDPLLSQVVVFPARLVSPLIDTSMVNWVKLCESYFKIQPNQQNQKIDYSKDWKRLGCAELVAKGWQFDDTDNTTVAVHRFTHQGYGNSHGKRTFDLVKEFPRIKTYYP